MDDNFNLDSNSSLIFSKKNIIVVIGIIFLSLIVYAIYANLSYTTPSASPAQIGTAENSQTEVLYEQNNESTPTFSPEVLDEIQRQFELDKKY